MLSLDEFESLVRARRATRHFTDQPIPDGLLDRLIDIARWSPSGYNLQPTHFIVVTDPAVKQSLRAACMDQRQVVEAPAVIVLTGDRRVVASQFREMLEQELNEGVINDAYRALLEKVIPLAFGQGPLGLGWLWKATLAPIARAAMPVPSIPAVHTRFWLTKQVMLCAMTLMHAAAAAGLATLPMEGFDEHRVRRVLKIPRSQIVPIVIPIGYPPPQRLRKTRLPLARFVHRERW